MARRRVTKTYKLYVNGAFVRSESGRYLSHRLARGGEIVHFPRASRKDLRDAVRAARAAWPGWAGRSAFNRGQILFRLSEMLEDRRASLTDRLRAHLGWPLPAARAEVDTAVDRLFWYAGWADKFSQILGCVNPVGASFFNFTFPQPTGVVAVFPSRRSPLVGLVSVLAPVLVPGNTAVVILDGEALGVGLDFAEVVHTSDVPPGVVNLLTGRREELLPQAAGHMDVNALALVGGEEEERRCTQELAAANVKRVWVEDDPPARAWRAESRQSPYRIEPFVEWKTAWHPIGL